MTGKKEKLSPQQREKLLRSLKALKAAEVSVTIVKHWNQGKNINQQGTDCLILLELMKELTGEPAVMWGKAKVGFGSFHYRGKTSEGDWFHVGFSPRKHDLALYLHCELEKQTSLLEKLGKHKIGKSCLYIRKLEDVHLPTLKKLIMKAYHSPAIAGATID